MKIINVNFPLSRFLTKICVMDFMMEVKLNNTIKLNFFHDCLILIIKNYSIQMKLNALLINIIIFCIIIIIYFFLLISIRYNYFFYNIINILSY